MATDPNLASTPNNGAAILGAAETSLTVPTAASVIYTAGANGGQPSEVVITALGTTVGGFVYLFRYDGATYWLFDIIPVTAITPNAGASPPTPAFHVVQRYSGLILKAAGSIRASQSVAGNANLLVAQAFGGDF